MTSSAEHANESFHEAYDRVRQVAVQDDPVLVVLADQLTLVRGDARTERLFTPDTFHELKAVAHVPIAVFAACHGAEGQPLAAATREGLERLSQRLGPLARDFEALPAAPDGDDMVASLLHLVSMSAAFVKEALHAGVVPPRLSEFARQLGPGLLRCTRDATRLQLAALHAHATAALADLDARERAALEVVVAGAHQARVRSLAMQYFEKLLHEPPGAELRLTYAEGVETVEEALLLVGTRRLDRAIAAAFFGDAHRLQRDVLGDAAREELSELDVRPSGAG